MDLNPSLRGKNPNSSDISKMSLYLVLKEGGNFEKNMFENTKESKVLHSVYFALDVETLKETQKKLNSIINWPQNIDCSSSYRNSHEN